MDQKISQLPAASDALATDVIPVVSNGANQKMTIGVLSLNLPNFGNKGITKNTSVSPVDTTLPLSNSLIEINIATNYSIANGASGQEITIVNRAATQSTINYGSGVATISASGVLTILFLGSSWYIKSSNLCTFA
jgi:hypothetical protein